MLMAEMAKSSARIRNNLNLARIRVIKTCTKVSGERELPASGLCDTLIIEGNCPLIQPAVPPEPLPIRP
tara:strand:+ start:554 stop:760 length:207 start_codon:yes stop_codon:yes gene_type:complete